MKETTMYERIKKRREELGLEQKDIANIIGISKSAVSQWESGAVKGIRPEHLLKLVEILQTTPEWIVSGKGNQLPEKKANSTASLGKFEVVKVRPFPLISWVQAGDWSEAIDLYEPGYAERFELFAVEGRISDHAFAIRVRGDSMEPDFLEGDIILVDPERAPNNGSYVIAKLTDTNECTFKKYVNDGGIISLHPLNYPKYQPIHLNGKKAHIVGVVIAKQQKFF